MFTSSTSARFLPNSILLMALIITGCSSRPSESDIQAAIHQTETARSTATVLPSATSTPTVTPTSTPTSTPTVTPPLTPRPLSQTDLQETLLTLEDIPAGWAKGADEVEDDSDTFSFLCLEFQKKSIATASVSFEQGQMGPFLVNSLTTYNPDEGKKLFAEMKAAVDQCPIITETQNGETTEWTISPVSFPQLGDESFAVRASSDFLLGFVEMDSVYFRIGDTLSSTMYLVLGLESIDSTLTEQFATTAEKKLTEAIRGTQ